MFSPVHEIGRRSHAQPGGLPVVCSVCHVECAIDSDDSWIFTTAGNLIGLSRRNNRLVIPSEVVAVIRPSETDRRCFRRVLSPVQKPDFVVNDDCGWIVQIRRFPIVCWVWSKDGILCVLFESQERELLFF